MEVWFAADLLAVQGIVGIPFLPALGPLTQYEGGDQPKANRYRPTNQHGNICVNIQGDVDGKDDNDTYDDDHVGAHVIEDASSPALGSTRWEAEWFSEGGDAEATEEVGGKENRQEISKTRCVEQANARWRAKIWAGDGNGSLTARSITPGSWPTPVSRPPSWLGIGACPEQPCTGASQGMRPSTQGWYWSSVAAKGYRALTVHDQVLSANRCITGRQGRAGQFDKKGERL